MSELSKRLERLFLKLDRAALAVEQHLADMLFAVNSNNLSDAEAIIAGDEAIDRREVEIERECIRLLALYQPAASDLRKICFAIKVNNDLERIADNCVSSAKMMPILIEDQILINQFSAFRILSDSVTDAVQQTIRLLSTDQTVPLAVSIIKNDRLVVDEAFRNFLQAVFAEGERLHGQVNAVYALTSIGRALERIGDLCTNIAEDTVFLLTGEIVRHTI
ncbi:MAG: phosphate signaling complex protein PhoU [Planctomycetaceae bacterium]|nr:phosphate signaling complex protein PhoU [Planctomycetaceae bacterium]